MEIVEGSVAVVTGGAGGIGAALGHAFADAGCSVVLADVEAAALDASGLSPINLEPGPDGRSVLFVFAEPAQAQELSRRFWSGQLHISARTYSDSLRRLKDRLFSNGRRA